MASATTCRSCLRVLRLQARHHKAIDVALPSKSFARPSTRAVAIQPRTLYRSYATEPASTSAQNAASSHSATETAAAESETSDFKETYVAKQKSEILFKECAKQADYIVPQAFEKDGETPKNAAGEEIGQGVGWWYETLGLTPTFNTWFQITSLHLYLLTVRLRYLPPKRHAIWLQHLSDHFFYEAEHRMTLFHRISSRAIRNRYLKDLYNQWRGVQGAYDEGLVKGDAVLATAIWRNIFKADENVDWRQVAQITSYVRRGLRGLDRTSEDMLLNAKIKFAGPASEAALVEEEARGLKSAFEKEDEVFLEEWEQEKKTSST